MPKRVPGALGALPMSKKWSETLKPRVSAERWVMSFKSSKLKFFFRWLSQNLAFYHWQVLICTPLSHIEVMAAFFWLQVNLPHRKQHAIAVSRANIKTYQPRIAFWHHPIQQTEQVSLYTWKSALFTLLVHMREKTTKTQPAKWRMNVAKPNRFSSNQNWCSADKRSVCWMTVCFQSVSIPFKWQASVSTEAQASTSHFTPAFFGHVPIEVAGWLDEMHSTKLPENVEGAERCAMQRFALPRSSKPSSCCKAAGHWRFSACAKTTVATETGFAFNTRTQWDTLTTKVE